MKPFKTFLILLSLISIILGVTLVNSYFRLALDNYIQLPQFLPDSNVIENHDVQAIQFVDSSLLPDDTIAKEIRPVKTKKENPIPTVEKQSTPRISKKELFTKIPQLEYTELEQTGLHYFFNSLNEARAQKQIRILHYGDSQIEGDRITSYIRRKFQSQFGGKGIGMFSTQPINNNLSVRIHSSSGWNKYTERDIKNNNLQHNRLGILMNYTEFENKSGIFNNTNSQPHTFVIDRSKIAYSGAGDFDVFRVIYGYAKNPVTTYLKNENKETLVKKVLPVNNNWHILNYSFKTPPTKIIYECEGASSPQFFALSLDSKTGVAVDNIPIRGSKGNMFSETHSVLYSQLMNELNVRLIILEFGVNLVPMLKTDYSDYEADLIKQIRFFKKANPNIPVIIMSVTDMSQKNGTQYETYFNIPAIHKAQKNAARKTNSIFWDTYKAMGGKNSMPIWVNSNLARNDYTHFTADGAKIIAEMFYIALMNEYDNFSKNSTTH